jgi:hypothetical protein
MLPIIDQKIEFHRKFTGCIPSIIVLTIEEFKELEIYLNNTKLKLHGFSLPEFEEIYAIVDHNFVCEYNGVKLYVKLESELKNEYKESIYL